MTRDTLQPMKARIGSAHETWSPPLHDTTSRPVTVQLAGSEDGDLQVGDGSLMELLDAAATERLLLWGALPPEGRDYDLMCHPRDLPGLRSWLRHAGFVHLGGTTRWFRLSGDEAQVVDLFPADRVVGHQGEIDALFSEARPCPGYRRLCLPSPVHEILLQAVKATWSVPIPHGRQVRIEQALRRDPNVWHHAWHRGRTWGIEDDVERLKIAWRTGGPFTPRRRQALRAVGRRILRGTYPDAQRRGILIGISGLDGSGKSRQAWLLRAALHNLGRDAVIEWHRVGRDPSVEAVKRSLRPVMGLMRSRRGRATGHSRAKAQRSSGPASGLHVGLRAVWVILITLANGAAYRRTVHAHTRRGQDVIYDRYVLDSLVELRFRFGDGAVLALARQLLRVLVPKPAVTFLLVVPPDVALARKADGFDARDLAQQAHLYTEEAARLRVETLDGTLPPSTLFARIVAEAARLVG